ncbi:hypothetical protein [Trinickia diaoshuihuensis]|jgi:hypothetical protein|uniref:hypothetical protein n=1 Tax=Trinickia diaoshuihuensis TaxID=2292265 RepID=UPI000E25E257|nr:hypothetical protein [Trinickia diaoshuihuensis]
MISRSALALAGALLAAGTLPAHAETNALAGAASKLSGESAGPGQLFPPLPSLASLPPSAAEQVEDAAPANGGRRTGKKGHKSASRKSAAEPVVRVVVSDESQLYLTQVDRKLDDILHASARSAHGGADTVSVAWTR